MLSFDRMSLCELVTLRLGAWPTSTRRCSDFFLPLGLPLAYLCAVTRCQHGYLHSCAPFTSGPPSLYSIPFFFLFITSTHTQTTERLCSRPAIITTAYNTQSLPVKLPTDNRQSTKKRSFAAALVAAATATLVAAQLRIETPTNLAVCQPALLSWTGGESPYYVSVIPGGQPSAASL